LCCVCLLSAVGGCGLRATAAATIPPATASSVVRVRALQTSAFPSNKVAAFDVTSTDATRVAQVYAAITALAPYPPGTRFCPLDIGILYT
jgi:hypothetical protein